MFNPRKLSISKLHNSWMNEMILHHFGYFLTKINWFQIYMFQKADFTYVSRKYIRSLGLNCQINSFIDVANGCRKLISKNFVENFFSQFCKYVYCAYRTFNILTSFFFISWWAGSQSFWNFVFMILLTVHLKLSY